MRRDAPAGQHQPCAQRLRPKAPRLCTPPAVCCWKLPASARTPGGNESQLQLIELSLHELDGSCGLRRSSRLRPLGLGWTCRSRVRCRRRRRRRCHGTSTSFLSGRRLPKPACCGLCGVQTAAPRSTCRLRVRRFCGKKELAGPGATGWRRVRELVSGAAAARARGARTSAQQGLAGMPGLAGLGKAAAGAAEEAGRGTPVAQAARAERVSREERAAVSERRQMATREGAARGKREREQGSRAYVSTIGKGASARSAEGRASASTIGKGASARSAEGRASASTLG